MTNDSRALLFGLAAVAGWSTVATAFKIALAFVDPLQLLFHANLAAVVVLIAVTLWQSDLRTLIGSFRAHAGITLLAGCLNPVFYYLLLFEAYDQLPAQVAMSINYTWAIVLAFMAIVFLQQKIRWADLAAAFACYFGVVIIATGGRFDTLGETSATGLVLAVGSTFVWAAYWIINVRDSRQPVIGLTLNFLVALPITALVCLVFSDPVIPVKGWAASVYVGLVEMAIGFVLWSAALKLTTNTSRVSNLIFLSPFASLVFIAVFLGEPIAPSTLAGLVLIIGGLAGQQYFHGRRGQLENSGVAPK